MQRRVEQAHGDGQPVHGLEDLDEVLPLDLAELVQGGLLLLGGVGQDHAPARPAGGPRRGTCARCGTGRCPRPRTRRPWPRRRPVSALARTPSLPPRISSAHSRTVANSGGVSPATRPTSPRTTSPVVPSMEMTSPARTVTPPTVNESPEILTASAPHDRRLAPAPGHDGGVADQPAAGGEDALGGGHAVHVLGRGLVAHEDDLLAPVGGLGRPVGGEARLAHGGAGRGGQALGDDLALGAGLELRVEHGVEVLGADPQDGRRAGRLEALVHVMSTAICRAARPVRLPTRVCSIQSLPCSMVNSVSHMSR